MPLNSPDRISMGTEETSIIRKLSLKSRLTIGGILLISILGSLVIIYATKWGPWVFSDSTEYIVLARNLLAGHGLGYYAPSGAFHPQTLHPPFYTLLLSFFGMFGADLVTTARWMDVSLFGLTILLVGVSLYTFTRSSWLAFIGSFMLFSMPALVDVYSGAMSEPLFIFTGFAGISLILWFLKTNRFILLITAAFASGLSLFTRYVGLAFMITGVISLLVFSPKTWKKRAIDVLIYGSIGSLPIIGWLAWLKFQSVNPRNIQPVINLGEQLTNLRLGLMEIFWSWLPFTSLLPPYSYKLAKNYLIIAAAVLIIFSSLIIWKIRKNNIISTGSSHGLRFAGSMITFSIAYLIILAFSYIYTNPTPDLNNRTLLPVQIALLIGFFILCFITIQAWLSIKWLPLLPILLAVGISSSYLHNTIDIASQYHREGSGYTSLRWRNSETIQAVEQLPSDIPLISNDTAIVLFYTNRPVYEIAELTNNKPLSFTRYGDDPTDPAQNAFRDHGAALILFKASFWQFHQLYGDQTTKRLEEFTKGLYLFAEFSDGAIYFYYVPAK